MEIAGLGGGNGALAAAADLTQPGHRVRLWRRDQAAIAALQAAGRAVTAKDHSGHRTVELAVATHDLSEAVDRADLILCPTPATAHDAIANRLAPELRDGQVVFLPPGTFGSYLFARAMRRAGNMAEVGFAEAGTLPYLARKHGPHAAAITTPATRFPTGVFPRRPQAPTFPILPAPFAAAAPAGHPPSAALM